MNHLEAMAIVNGEARISLRDPSLLGWKTASQELDPAAPDTIMVLAGIIRDCQGIGGTRSIAHRLVINDRNGHLVIMTRPPHLPLY